MIPVFRNVDSPRGDFGLTRQDGDEEFVVLTREEYAALRPATPPDVEAVTLWGGDRCWVESQPSPYGEGYHEYRALPAPAYAALLGRLKDLERKFHNTEQDANRLQKERDRCLDEIKCVYAAIAIDPFKGKVTTCAEDVKQYVDALLARLHEADARANTATVAAELMRARAERAEALLREAMTVGIPLHRHEIATRITAALKARG